MNSKKILRTIGLNIRSAREKAGLTQEGLAEQADVHWKTVGYIEGGYRDFGVTTLVRIAIILKITQHILSDLEMHDKRDVAIIKKATVRKRKAKKNSGR